jgi:hypothetical protein
MRKNLSIRRSSPNCDAVRNKALDVVHLEILR